MLYKINSKIINKGFHIQGGFMDKDITLVIFAAGMVSRFGGLKQI